MQRVGARSTARDSVGDDDGSRAARLSSMLRRPASAQQVVVQRAAGERMYRIAGTAASIVTTSGFPRAAPVARVVEVRSASARAHTRSREGLVAPHHDRDDAQAAVDAEPLYSSPKREPAQQVAQPSGEREVRVPVAREGARRVGPVSRPPRYSTSARTPSRGLAARATAARAGRARGRRAQVAAVPAARGGTRRRRRRRRPRRRPRRRARI